MSKIHPGALLAKTMVCSVHTCSGPDFRVVGNEKQGENAQTLCWWQTLPERQDCLDHNIRIP